MTSAQGNARSAAGRALLLTLLTSVALAAASLAQAADAPQEQYHGIPAGFTGNGDPYLGHTDAPITLEEWSDYQCPYCARHFRETLPQLLEKYLRPGKVRLVFRDFPLESLHAAAPLAHVAARCAGHEGAAKYWAMHDALFERQVQWQAAPDPQPAMTEIAAGVGADPDAFTACLNAPDARAALTASIAAGNELKYVSTPTFRFLWNADQSTHQLAGAYPMARFDEILTAASEGKEIPVEAPPKPPELPRWAKPEGHAPDPARPGHTIMGDPYKGSPQAKVTVVEFSDFECPACAKHALEWQPQIDAALVETGKVRWISKHLPLRVHAHAALAAAAAECASDQGRYWPMHDMLYRRQAEWTTDDAATVLAQIARDAGLDGDAFDQCFNSRRGLERVLADLYDAQGVVERTPSFVILPGDGTGTLTGGMPAEGFIKFLNDVIDGQKATPKQ